jgi:hypothetical protein
VHKRESSINLRTSRFIDQCGHDAADAIDEDSGGAQDPCLAELKRKKPYQPPEVTEYGKVAGLTAGSGGTDLDSHGQRNRHES